MGRARRFRSALVCAAALAAAPVAASDYSAGVSGAEARKLVAAALAAHGLAADPTISAARHYPPCGHTPRIAPRGGTWTTVEMSCSAPSAWSRALRTGIAPDPLPATPVEITPDGPLMATLTVSLAAGAVIAPEHVALSPASAAAGTGGFGNTADVIGRRLKVGLGDGHVVLARHLEQDWLIVAGTPVAIAFEGGAVQVIAPGEAMQNGQRGDLIDVRNRASGRIVNAYVLERNKVGVSAKLN
ncbi:flagellar basal body P-ring formation chaperone FlgA [Meridianimarinicoccus sp. RP-17]|uniref:flagellar basal body P-ring formation chaperone FlgA n=1 Tax=Meridianimarinicoccus zhengii TaxID=2056810 RepID=UPI000DAB5B87|nr:flagellar basal body P-ring formation chaperone FlgA [Phycocomes zhengii]